MEHKYKNFKTRSRNVEHILKSPNINLIKWGNFYVLLILIIFFVLSNIIKYPEYVSSTFYVYPTSPQMKNKLQLAEISVSDVGSDRIKANQIININVDNTEYSIQGKVYEVVYDDNDRYVVRVEFDHKYTDILKKIAFSKQVDTKIFLGEVTIFERIKKKIFHKNTMDR